METAEDGTKSVRRINSTLLEMMAGILAFTLLCQVTVVWFVEEQLKYSMGLWIGALMAALAAAHMYRALDRALDDEGTAAKVIQKNSIIRYCAIVAVFAVIMITEAVNPLSAFLGLMGLKVAAYIQPFTHRFISSTRKEK